MLDKSILDSIESNFGYVKELEKVQNNFPEQPIDFKEG